MNNRKIMWIVFVVGIGSLIFLISFGKGKDALEYDTHSYVDDIVTKCQMSSETQQDIDLLVGRLKKTDRKDDLGVSLFDFGPNCSKKILNSVISNEGRISARSYLAYLLQESHDFIKIIPRIDENKYFFDVIMGYFLTDSLSLIDKKTAVRLRRRVRLLSLNRKLECYLIHKINYATKTNSNSFCRDGVSGFLYYYAYEYYPFAKDNSKGLTIRVLGNTLKVCDVYELCKEFQVDMDKCYAKSMVCSVYLKYNIAHGELRPFYSLLKNLNRDSISISIVLALRRLNMIDDSCNIVVARQNLHTYLKKYGSNISLKGLRAICKKKYVPNGSEFNEKKFLKLLVN